MNSTKEQQEIVDFTYKEFCKYSIEERRPMYEAIRIFAMIKWPGEDFGPSFLKKGKHMNEFTQDQISTQMAEVHQEHPAMEVQAGRDETPVKVKEVFVQDDEHIGGTPVVM